MVQGISGVVWSLRLVHTRSSCPFGLWVDDECMEPLSFECPFRCLDFVIHDHVAQSQFSFMQKLAKLEINLVLSPIFFSELYLSSPQSLGLDCEGKTLLG